MNIFKSILFIIVMDGKIPPPKEGAKVTIRSISVGKKRMIMTIHETSGSITIYVGNRTVYCIDVFLEKNLLGKILPLGNLSKLRWDKVCTLDDDFEKGKDSVMLLKLVISFIHSNYPSVKEIIFTDLSSKECDDGNTISLAALKYLTVGKTWYEETFGASLDKGQISFYDNMEKQLLEKKKNITWGYLKEIMPAGKMEIPEDEIKELYEKTSRWQDFFYPIVERLGKSKTCILFAPWFDRFVRTYLRISFISLRYSLPVKDHEIPYTMTGGRRRRTIKNKK